MICDCPVTNVLVNQQEFLALRGSATIERNKVLMSQTSEDLDFIHELFDPSVALLI